MTLACGILLGFILLHFGYGLCAAVVNQWERRLRYPQIRRGELLDECFWFLIILLLGGIPTMVYISWASAKQILSDAKAAAAAAQRTAGWPPKEQPRMRSSYQ